MYHHPALALFVSGARRFAWAAFGASLATAFFATRASHLAGPITPATVTPVKVVATVVAPPLERAVPVRDVPAPVFPTPQRRVMGPADASACSRAWAEGGVYRAAYGVTYVTREMVDETLESQAELMRSARIVPERENGAIVGVKMFGIRPGSFMDRLGFQNGDSLRTVDGYDVVSPDHALEAYAKLRASNDYHVSIVRFGAPRTLIYRVC